MLCVCLSGCVCGCDASAKLKRGAFWRWRSKRRLKKEGKRTALSSKQQSESHYKIMLLLHDISAAEVTRRSRCQLVSAFNTCYSTVKSPVEVFLLRVLAARGSSYHA